MKYIFLMLLTILFMILIACNGGQLTTEKRKRQSINLLIQTELDEYLLRVEYKKYLHKTPRLL